MGHLVGTPVVVVRGRWSNEPGIVYGQSESGRTLVVRLTRPAVEDHIVAVRATSVEVYS